MRSQRDDASSSTSDGAGRADRGRGDGERPAGRHLVVDEQDRRPGGDLGIEPTAAAEWGYDLNRSVADVTAGIWWTAVFPGLAIVLIVLGITLVGESLNDLADPRLRARKSAGEVIGSIEDTSVEPNVEPSADNEYAMSLMSTAPGAADVDGKEPDHE